MDLSTLSTEELLRMGDAPTTDLSKIPTEELLKMRDAAPASPAPTQSPGVLDTALGGVKQAGVGLAKGTIGVGGSGGDIWSLIDTGLGKVGLDEGTRGAVRQVLAATPLGISLRGPTSKDIQGKVEEYTGEFRKPQGPLERNIDTVASFAPGAIGPGGPVRNFLKYAFLPGVASEAAGEATKGTKAEPYVRAGTAVATGGAAALLTRPRSAASAVRDAIPDNVTSAQIDAAERLFQEATHAGVPITRAEAVQHVTGGASRLGDLQRVAEGAGEMKPFFAARPAQVETAGRRTFDELAPRPAQPSTVGPQVGVAAEGAVGDVRGAINRAADPFYNSAADVRLTPAEIGRIRALPGYDEAAAAVRNDPQLARYVQGLPEDSYGFLNEVKKFLDQASTNAASGLTGRQNMQRSAGYGTDASTVRDTLRDRMTPVAGGAVPAPGSTAYRTALDIESTGRSRYLDPLLQGPLGQLAKRDIATKQAIDVLFPTQPLANSAEEITTAVRAVARRNPVAARQLVQAHVESVFNEATQNLVSGPNQFGGANFAAVLRGNPQQAANLEASVRALPNGDQLWTGLDRFLTFVEAQGTRQPIGSKTTFNTQLSADLARGTPLQEAGTALATVGLKWPQKAKDTLERWRLGRGVSEIAHLLTSPEATHRFRQIASMPAGSREAASIMGRLVLIANQAAEAKSTDKPERGRDQDRR